MRLGGVVFRSKFADSEGDGFLSKWSSKTENDFYVPEEYIVGPDFQPLHGRYTPGDLRSIQKAQADTIVIRDRVNELYASAPNGSSLYLRDIHALEAIPLFETSCNFVDYAYRTRQLMGEPTLVCHCRLCRGASMLMWVGNTTCPAGHLCFVLFTQTFHWSSKAGLLSCLEL